MFNSKVLMNYIQFDAARIPEDTHSLILRLKGALGHNANPNLPHSLATATGHYDFTFSVPFHAGRRVDVHQTVTAAGIRITLDHIIVTPSELRYFMSGFVLQPRGESVKSGPYVGGVQYDFKSPFTQFKL